MSAQAGVGESSSYLSRFFLLTWLSLVQLVRPPSQSRRAEAARRAAREVLLLITVGGVAVIVLMYAIDAWEIALMPPRGAAYLWPFRVLTDFGKSEYVLSGLAGLLLIFGLLTAGSRGALRILLRRIGTRLQFVFLAVLVPVFVAEGIKWCFGRGRPFVGGHANPFNFAPFNGTEAYASFPSGHAVTAFALALAVSAVCSRSRLGFYLYAVGIAATRLVLLAHHPSDVVAGALIGTVGALFVRYWFAERRLCFTIRPNGAIVALALPSLQRVKRVARNASAP
jgi:membrane-associated phospholipid phosphatase